MNEAYEYRTVRVERGAWARAARAVTGERAPLVREAGGSIYALWTPQIGFASDEGIIMTSWAGEPAMVDGSRVLDDVDGVIESDVERLVSTVRPADPIPPTEGGVYAHRWFEVEEQNWDEFLHLSEEAWGPWEAAYPGIRVIGLWRSLQPAPAPVRALLVTRYPSLADWERSRPYAPHAPEGAIEARERFARRSEITERTIVRVARLDTSTRSGSR